MADLYNGQLDAFDLYHQFIEEQKRTRSSLDGPALPPIGHAVSGAAGAAISNILTYPLDLIITRLQIQRQVLKNPLTPDNSEYKSIRDAFEKIYNKEGGVAGFYAGLLHDTGKTLADSFLFFLAYNFVRQSRLKRQSGKSQNLPVLEELSVGFIAGAFSKFLTTPIANVVTRLQTSSMTGAGASEGKQKITARSIARQIRVEKGLKGFWSGYSASLILTLNPSLTFFFFETFKRLTLPRAKRQNPPPSATFLLAALSKALASTITYPFSLAKARAQVSSRSVNEDGPAQSTEPEHTSYEKAAVSATKRTAVRKTVFSVILEIARNEGVGALYEGLSGEVLKGFFSHGVTMILKDAVQRLIIHLYYIVLKILRKYPNPEELAQAAKERAQDAVEAAKEGFEAAGGRAQEMARDARRVAGDGMQATQDAAEKVAEKVSGNTDK